MRGEITGNWSLLSFFSWWSFQYHVSLSIRGEKWSKFTRLFSERNPANSLPLTQRVCHWVFAICTLYSLSICVDMYVLYICCHVCTYNQECIYTPKYGWISKSCAKKASIKAHASTQSSITSMNYSIVLAIWYMDMRRQDGPGGFQETESFLGSWCVFSFVIVGCTSVCLWPNHWE